MADGAAAPGALARLITLHETLFFLSQSAREGMIRPLRPAMAGAMQSAFRTASCVVSAAARKAMSM
ncbi:hypothetical protein ACVI3U_004357 [Sinorhizobium medicae]